MLGGRTAHSRVKIPIKLENDSFCLITKQSNLAALLRETKLIIWDEAPMASCLAMEALDRSLQDIMNNDLPFCGKVIVFGGDFRQVLPVVRKGSRPEIVNASLLESRLWTHNKVFKRRLNMQAREALEFADFLMEVGNGTRVYVREEYICLPVQMVVCPS